ncbi:MAG: CHASE2 domain-containing protein [Muribaculaceae bacterium]|nr:CHASE2 domain-containing protein [Muribaculaceae bacterium]
MNRVSESMSSLRPSVKGVVITVFTLLFSHVALYDLTSVSFFSPMEKAADFRFSDFYTLVADKGAVASYEKDIVIVPVDGCDRIRMARAISDIDFCSPAAVGLDIFFAPLQGEGDDPIAEALSECDNLVMPVMVKADSTGLRTMHLSCYDSYVEPSGGYAAVNIQGNEDERDCVRDFRCQFETADGTVKSLAAALAGRGFPESYKRLEARPSESETIAYASREFEVVTPDEILDNQDLIEGRIVLVGKLQDRADMHVTPLHNFTPGLMIHAYITATILDGDYTRKLRTWENILVAAILCYIITWINLHLMKSVMGPIFIRTLQIGLLYFLILTGTLVYIHFHIDLNFSYSILTVSLGVAACEVYEAVFHEDGLIDYITTKLKKRKQTEHEEKSIKPEGMDNDATSGGGLPG